MLAGLGRAGSLPSYSWVSVAAGYRTSLDRDDFVEAPRAGYESAPRCGGCEQAQGAGAGDGLAAPVRAELQVEVVDVGLDGVRRDGQLAGDLRPGQVGRQVAQHADLAVAERLQRRLRTAGRRRGPRSGQHAEDLGEPGGVGAAVPGA